MAAGGSVSLRLEVIDTGVGISPDALTKIFDRFTQEDVSTTRRFGGSGLGLTICRQLAELMDGTLGVHSVEGKGSTFWFEVALPVDPESRQAALIGLQLGQPAPHGPRRFDGRVLVAEDNEINQLVIVQMLETLGCTTDVAVNGIEATERGQQGGYDLILMDCQMPKLDGLEATRRIRATTGDARGVPIVALTASAAEAERERCLAAGMNAHVSKPITLEALERVLASYLPERG